MGEFHFPMSVNRLQKTTIYLDQNEFTEMDSRIVFSPQRSVQETLRTMISNLEFNECPTR